jgi:hypothetical protein
VEVLISLFDPTNWGDGLRVELERSTGHEISHEQESAVHLIERALQREWEPVPAPKFEGHSTVSSELVGRTAPVGPLSGMSFFEATTFVGRSSTIVTFAGESLESVLSDTEHLDRAATIRGAVVSSTVVEEVIGAWRQRR